MQGMNEIKTWVFVLGILLCTISAESKHIVGGDMTYKCLGIDTFSNRVTFEITLTMYRDCYQDGQSLTPYDPSARIGIHIGSGNNWRFYDELNPPILENEVGWGEVVDRDPSRQLFEKPGPFENLASSYTKIEK